MMPIWRCWLERLRAPLSRPIRTRTTRLNVEPLEDRAVPATLVSPTTLTYQDFDGDNVTVRFSLPVLNAGNVNSIFMFSSGAGAVNGSNATKEGLLKINLMGVTGAAGTSVTTTAVRSLTNGGDGFATLGELLALNLDLGVVNLDGDLGRVLAGDAITATAGLKALTVQSLGRYGLGTGATDLHTVVTGRLGALTVKGDVVEAFVDIQGGVDGDLGTVTINGSLLGGMALNSGRLHAAGDIGLVTIKGDLTGSGGERSASIDADGNLAGLTVGGSLRGGMGSRSASVWAGGNMGNVKIAGSVVGLASTSGSIMSAHKMATVTIGGSLIGGTLANNASSSSGRIHAGDDLGLVTIRGDVVGGSSQSAGMIGSSKKIAGVTIGGSLLGGDWQNTGVIFGLGDVGLVSIKGGVVGRAFDSGMIISGGKLAGVTIGGSLLGGTGTDSGRINAGGDIGFIKIGGDLTGAGTGTGNIGSHGNIASITIGGSVRGGSSRSGAIVVDGTISTLTIGGDVLGGSASGNTFQVESGFITAKRISTLVIGGSVIAGVDDTTNTFRNNGAIRVVDDLGTVLIKGSLVGNSTNPVILSARGQATPTALADLAIASLTVKGRVERALLLAGVDPSGNAKNADAQIGVVTVGGDWIASSLAAGTTAGADGFFGNADDVKMSGANVKDVAGLSSRIKGLVIAGQVLGTTNGNDYYGIVAENVGTLKVGGTAMPLVTGNGNDDHLCAITGDLKVNEV